MKIPFWCSNDCGVRYSGRKTLRSEMTISDESEDIRLLTEFRFCLMMDVGWFDLLSTCNGSLLGFR